MIPFMLQLYATNCSREVEKFPMEIGRVPFNGLFATTILVKFMHFVKYERNVNSRVEDSLVKLLVAKLSTSRCLKFPRVLGIEPEKSLRPTVDK